MAHDIFKNLLKPRKNEDENVDPLEDAQERDLREICRMGIAYYGGQRLWPETNQFFNNILDRYIDLHDATVPSKSQPFVAAGLFSWDPGMLSKWISARIFLNQVNSTACINLRYR